VGGSTRSRSHRGEHEGHPSSGGGAFEGLEKIVERRVSQKSMGFARI
jgi:hypothetical protein